MKILDCNKDFFESPKKIRPLQEELALEIIRQAKKGFGSPGKKTGQRSVRSSSVVV